ncbi:848_t:CDS:1, partial [Racocetra persica]
MVDLFGGEEVYNEKYKVEDCHVHGNSSKCTPCKKCDKLTFSKYDACIIHA